jgi:hypothetical protein
MSKILENCGVCCARAKNWMAPKKIETGAAHRSDSYQSSIRFAMAFA